MSNNKWFDSLRSVFSPKGNETAQAEQAPKEVCPLCSRGLKCATHFAKAQAKAGAAPTPAMVELNKKIDSLNRDAEDVESKVSEVQGTNVMLAELEARRNEAEAQLANALRRVALAQQNLETQKAVQAVMEEIGYNHDLALAQMAAAPNEVLVAQARASLPAPKTTEELVAELLTKHAKPSVTHVPVGHKSASAPATPTTPPTAPGNGATRREPEAEGAKESKYGAPKWDTEMVPKLEALGVNGDRIKTLGVKAKEGKLVRCLEWAEAIEAQGVKYGVDNPAQLRQILALLVGTSNKEGYRSALWARVTLSLEGVDSSTLDNTKVCAIARDLLGLTKAPAAPTTPSESRSTPESRPMDDMDFFTPNREDEEDEEEGNSNGSEEKSKDQFNVDRGRGKTGAAQNGKA